MQHIAELHSIYNMIIKYCIPAQAQLKVQESALSTIMAEKDELVEAKTTLEV